MLAKNGVVYENMNIKIDEENRKFKFRVAGLLIVDNKLLTVEIMNNGINCLPGGHVMIGENTKDAIIREFMEETKLNVSVKKIECIIENLFNRSNGDLVHEIQVIYSLKLNDEIEVKDWQYIEVDEDFKKQLAFKWIDIDKLDCVKPIIVNKLINNDKVLHFIVNNDLIINEE